MARSSVIGLVLLVLLALPTALRAAEVRVDHYASSFNTAAGAIGSPFRLSPSECSDDLCNYSGEHGLSAVAMADAPKKRLFDSMMRVPAKLTTTEVASIFLTILVMFSPEHPAAAREHFAVTLSQQQARDGFRAEGALGGWVYVLRRDPELWRIVVRKPGR